MGAKTGIPWADSTWNPITGCRPVSEGCAHCYAADLAERRLNNNPSYVGLVDNRQWTGEARFNPRMLDKPLRWRRPRRIFVCSMSDLFFEGVRDEWVDDVFSIMYQAPRHTFLILTKRVDRMRKYIVGRPEMSDPKCHPQLRIMCKLGKMKDGVLLDKDFQWPPPNAWFGVTAENQDRAEDRIGRLLDLATFTPMSKVFVSMEPMLGPMSMAPFLPEFPTLFPEPRKYIRFLDWVIIGEESGKGKRPLNINWVRNCKNECVVAGVPFLYKQGPDDNGKRTKMPKLDGVIWHQFPEGKE